MENSMEVFPEAVKTHSALTWMYRAAEDQNFPNEKVQSTCTDGQEQRSLGYMPTPSPRNVSVPKADFHKYSASDRPASPQYSDYQTACTLGEGELSRAEMARELDYLRQTNKKLQEALMSKESEVDTLKLDAELLEPTIQARIADNTAALVEEVYHAQRMREEAMMDQLRLANEERDEARLRLQQLELALKEGMDSSPEEGHMALQEILCGLQKASSRDAVQHNRTLVVEYFRKRRERAEQITAMEMGAIIQERDLARAQSKHLEKELHLLRESKQTCPDIVTAQKTFEPLSKAQMTFLQNDQDKVIENYKKLEEELQTLRLCYSLHQSLTQEAELKEQYSKAITIYEEALRNREDLLHITQQQNQDLCRQLQEAQTQSTEIQDTLQRTSADLHEAKDKTHKLERLVDVLRKKVGTGSVRSII